MCLKNENGEYCSLSFDNDYGDTEEDAIDRSPLDELCTPCMKEYASIRLNFLGTLSDNRHFEGYNETREDVVDPWTLFGGKCNFDTASALAGKYKYEIPAGLVGKVFYG